jgi:hypothetical protein
MTTREERKDGGALAARLVVGLAQGLALYFLSKARIAEPQFGLDAGLWAQLIPTFRLVAVFAPLPLLFGLGNLPARKLLPWASIAVLAVFAFGWFASAPAWRHAPTATWLFALIVLYIVHEFVQAAHDDRRAIASYETYFDRAWRHGFQGALAVGFTIAFWIVVSLGAWLFRLIGLEVVFDAITSELFRFVASAAAFALGVHLTDADAGLTRGARQLGLALLSWLAILMTLILAAFLAALPFTGLEPLWDTKRATVLLLNAAATMILLVNAAFQAGDPPKSAVMRAAVRFSAFPLAGVVALAALGLWLRVNQYGFTPARVLASAELWIVAVYAVGYVAAALKPGAWLSLIRPVNIAAALFVAAILTALMTPIADPARIAVADQVARLDKGAVEPDDFDFGFLADSRSGHWGKSALAKLSARSGSARDERIALLAKNPVAPDAWAPVEQSFNDRRAALAVIGAAPVPDAALLPIGANDPVSACVQSMKNYAEEARLEEERARQRDRLGRRLTSPVRPPDAAPATMEVDPDEGRCPARLMDVDFDGDDDLLILANDRWAQSGPLTIHALLAENDAWRYRGVVNNAGPAEASLRPGERRISLHRAGRRMAFERMTTAAHPLMDVVVDDRRVRIDRVVTAPADRAASLITPLDGAQPPAALFENRLGIDIAGHCSDYAFGASEEGACLSRMLDIDDDGAGEYALFSIGSSGHFSVAFFDAGSGSHVASGAVSIASFWDATNDVDADKARAKRAAERRRIAGAATLSEPLLGDLIVEGERASFAYVDPSPVLIAETAAR